VTSDPERLGCQLHVYGQDCVEFTCYGCGQVPSVSNSKAAVGQAQRG
jgi:hypothetical protein